MVGRGLLKINQSILTKDLQVNVRGITFTTSEAGSFLNIIKMDAILTNLKALSEDMLIEVIIGLSERFDDGAEIVLDAALNILHDSVSSEKFIEVCEGL